MALNTRIALKIDTLANWSKVDVPEVGGNLVLKRGEIAFVEIPSNTAGVTTSPTVLFKVGDGVTPFKDLKYGSAVAADVYAWAKKSSLDFNDLSDTFITALDEHISGEVDDTNTHYQIVEGTGDDEGKLLFQSRELGVEEWTTAFTYVKPTLASLGLTDEKMAEWDAKQDALDEDQLAVLDSGITAEKVGNYDEHIADEDIHVTAEEKEAWDAKQNAITETNKLDADLVDGLADVATSGAAADLTYDATHAAVTEAEKDAWDAKQDALTFNSTPSEQNYVVTKDDIAALEGAMHFRGVYENTEAVENPESGDIIIVGTTEYVYVPASGEGDDAVAAHWNELGDEGRFETQAHAAQTYVPVTRKVNGKALNADITLDASDVGVSATTNSITVGDTTISNIVTDGDYVHTDNNFTDEYVTKIDGIQEGATKVEASETNGNIKVNGEEVTVYDDSAILTGENINDFAAVEEALSGKVDAVEGSRLITTEEATKLAGIEEGAEANVLEAVKINGTALDIADKAVNILVDGTYAETNKIASMTSINTDNLLQGELEFVLDCGGSGVTATI